MSTSISGVNGTVKISSTAVATVTKWVLNKEVMTDRKGTNESSGFKVTALGSRHGSGTIEGLINTSAALTIVDNTAATVLLYVNATLYYSVPCVIKGFEVTTDINDGAYVSYRASFETNGAWTEPSWA